MRRECLQLLHQFTSREERMQRPSPDPPHIGRASVTSNIKETMWITSEKKGSPTPHFPRKTEGGRVEPVWYLFYRFMGRECSCHQCGTSRESWDRGKGRRGEGEWINGMDDTCAPTLLPVADMPHVRQAPDGILLQTLCRQSCWGEDRGGEGEGGARGGGSDKTCEEREGCR